MKSEGPGMIPISDIYFLSNMDPDIGWKKFEIYNRKCSNTPAHFASSHPPPPPVGCPRVPKTCPGGC